MANDYNYYKGYTDQEMGLGQTVPQPKSTYDKVWSFGLGAAGGVLTAAWYTGYATSAIALGPVSVPMALGAGVACFGYAVYSTVSEPKTLTTADKMVLVGGSVGAASMSLGALGFVVPKIAFGMTAVTGPFAFPLVIGGSIVYGFADSHDQNHRLDDAKSAFYGFAGGAFASSYLYLKMNQKEVDYFMYQHSVVPHVNHPQKMKVPFNEYSAQHQRFCGAQVTQIEVIDNLRKEYGAFINRGDLVRKAHQALSKPVVFHHKPGFKPGNVPVDYDDGFGTRQDYAAQLQQYRKEYPDVLVREGRESFAAAAGRMSQQLPNGKDLAGELAAAADSEYD